MSETRKNTPDIYKGQKENILKKLVTNNPGYDKESIQKRLEKLKNNEDIKKRKEINDKLKSLEAGSKEHIEYLNSLIEEEQKSITDKAKDNIAKTKEELENKAKETFETKKEELSDKLREKADKKIPFIGAAIYDWVKDLMKPVDKDAGVMDKAFSGIGKKIGAIILGWLGLTKGFRKMSEMKMGDVVIDEREEKPKEETKVAEDMKKEESPETVDKKEERYYRFGRLFVKKIGNENFTSKDDFNIITSNLKEKRYSDLKNYTYENYNEDFSNNLKKEHFEKIKNSLLGSDMEIFFSSTIKPERIKELSKIDKFNKILIDLGIDKESLNWRNLSLEKIFILFSLIISTEVIIGLKSIPGVSKVVFNQFLEIKDNFPGFKEIEKDLKELEIKYQKEVMPKTLIEKLFKIDGINEHGSYSWEIEKKNDFKNLDKNEKIYLKKVLIFKENFNKNILENKKYTFNNDRKKQIKDQISFKDVLTLYLSTKGKLNNDDDFSNAKIRGLLTLISQKENEGGEYLTDYNKYINTITNKDEKKKELLSKLIVEKIIDKGFFGPLIDKLITIGKTTIEIAKNNKIETGIGAVLLTLILKTYGKTVMKIKSLFFIGGASALAYGYYYLKNKGVSAEDRKYIKKAMSTVIPKKVLDSIDSGEYESADDYNKIIENSYNKINKKELSSTLGNFKIEGKKIFFTNKSNDKYELNFENDIHSLADTLGFDFGKDISKWTFSFDSINFVKNGNKYFININNDYYLDLNTLQKDGKKYKISIGENSQESITSDISSVKDFILDGFYFEKVI